MQLNGIKKILSIPGYKVSQIISISDSKIRIQVEPYKRKKAQCSLCGQVHKTGTQKAGQKRLWTNTTKLSVKRIARK